MWVVTCSAKRALEGDGFTSSWEAPLSTFDAQRALATLELLPLRDLTSATFQHNMRILEVYGIIEVAVWNEV